MNTKLHVFFENKDFFDNPCIAFDFTTAFILKRGSFTFRSENGICGKVTENSIALFPKGVVIKKEVLQSLECHLIFYKEDAEGLNEYFFKPIPISERNLQNIELLDKHYAFFKLDVDGFEEHICNDILYDIIYHDNNSFKTFVEQCVNKNMSIGQMADEYGYSYSGFLNKFKKEMQVLPCDYIQKKKLLKANQLLASGKSVVQTAMECSFNSEYYFSNWFKKQSGISPAEFKKRLRILF